MPAPKRSQAPLLIALALALVTVVAVAVAAVVLLSRRDDTVELTKAEKEDALLTADEVGDGFTEDADVDDTSDDLEIDDLEASDECLAYLEEAEEMEDGGFFTEGARSGSRSVQRDFEQEDGATLEHQISEEPNDGLDLFRRFLEVCPELDYENGEDLGSFAFAEGEPVEVGDDSVSIEFSLEIDAPVAVEIQALMVAWTRDGLGSSVTVTGPVGADLVGEDADPALLRSAVREADAKLVEVIGDAG